MKFKIGQTVRYRAPFGHVAAADYKVTQLLPAEDNELQYRIKWPTNHMNAWPGKANSGGRLTNGHPARAHRCLQS